MAAYYFRNVGTDWNTASNWSLTDGGGATGAVPTSADDAYFTSQSGSCTISTASRVCKTLIFSGIGAGDYANTFTLNNTLAVSGTVILSASMTYAGTSTLTINTAASLTSNGKTLTSSFNFTGSAALLTLEDNVTINGSFGIGSGTIRGNTLRVGGSFSQLSAGTTSTIDSNIELIGTGNITTGGGGGNFGGFGSIIVNTTGTITVTTLILNCTVGSARSFVYTAGNLLFAAAPAFLALGSGTNLILDLKGVPLAAGCFLGSQSGTISLLSDLVVNGGTFTFGSPIISGGQPLTINSTGGALYIGGTSLPTTVTIAANVSAIAGTAQIITGGGGFCTWLVSTAIGNNLTFNHAGVIRINQTGLGSPGLLFTTSGTYTYRSGRFESVDRFGSIGKGSISILASCTLIGFNELIGIGTFLITNGVTLTMDKFFCGSPTVVTNVTCATATGAYTVTFQDSSEKLANWVKVSNCTLSQRGQLIILNQKANAGRNTGVRYQNVWPNGPAKFQQNAPAQFAGSQMTFRDGGLLSDPAIAL